MKTAISLPDSVFEQAESLAKRLGLSRSELYAKAIQAYLQKYNREQILEQLNQTATPWKIVTCYSAKILLLSSISLYKIANY